MSQLTVELHPPCKRSQTQPSSSPQPELLLWSAQKLPFRAQEIRHHYVEKALRQDHAIYSILAPTQSMSISESLAHRAGKRIREQHGR